MRQDIRFAFTLLMRDRGFTVVAALALALGITATTCLITVVNAVILRGLPLADPDRLVAITMRDPRNRQLGMSYPDFDDWRRASRSFSEMTLMLPAAFSVSEENPLPEQFPGPFTSANLFKVIGQRPILDRDFSADDDLHPSSSSDMFGRVVAQVTLGLTLGVAGAYALGRVLQEVLVQTSATDPLILAGVGLVLILVAVLTCLVPARRAARIQPVAVLRAGS